ncbi:MAG TPA: hypothetical protein VG755_18440 [Nannocystaceae bacterium]|nr:hypothetical protein [Nannocystaceae bacterium]
MSLPPKKTYSTVALAAMLSKSVGDDVALDNVMRAVWHLRLPSGEITPDDALALFGVIAEGEGLVAIAARFVRSRLIAQFAREALETRAR